MPQFKFCFHLESKMSAAAPASSLPWSGPSPHCMRLRRNPPLSLCLYLTWWYEFSFPPDKSFSPLFFFPVIHHAFLWFQLEMVCIVWEVCVFAHLPSYWMLSDDCSRFLEFIFAVIEYSMLLLYRHQHKPQGNMLPNCTNPDHSSHLGQTDSNPPDAAKLLIFHRTLRKCVQPCAIGHTKKVGGVTDFKSKLEGDMSLWVSSL